MGVRDSLYIHAGQPFADASLFAANAICRLMRQHVAVALSGDGGDEGFGGYSTFWQLERIARFKQLPRPFQHGAYALLGSLSAFGLISPRLSRRVKELGDANDDTSNHAVAVLLAIRRRAAWALPRRNDASGSAVVRPAMGA